jgi:hypothetical protein
VHASACRAGVRRLRSGSGHIDRDRSEICGNGARAHAARSQHGPGCCRTAREDAAEIRCVGDAPGASDASILMVHGSGDRHPALTVRLRNPAGKPALSTGNRSVPRQSAQRSMAFRLRQLRGMTRAIVTRAVEAANRIDAAACGDTFNSFGSALRSCASHGSGSGRRGMGPHRRRAPPGHRSGSVGTALCALTLLRLRQSSWRGL